MPIDARNLERDLRREHAQIRETLPERVVDFEHRAPARIA
jgi:hypothetical protein